MPWPNCWPAQGEYGQAARLYARLQRLEPHNPRLPDLQAEMQQPGGRARRRKT